MKTTKLASVLGDHLELSSGQMLELDNPEFIRWLEASENRSFRFQYGFAGEHSFTARKEPSKKGQGDYWYGYRKVAGKLHKRYIGKTEDVTRLRLEEIAIALDTPAPERTKAESYINNYVTEAAAPTQPPGYINNYVTEAAAPTQPPGYINNYVTKGEFVACQQHCEELETELQQLQQERDRLEKQNQFLEESKSDFIKQKDNWYECLRETRRLEEEAEQLLKQLAALEQENAKLIDNLVESERLCSALNQNQELPDYGAAQLRALAKLKLGKQAPEYKRAKKAMDLLLDEL